MDEMAKGDKYRDINDVYREYKGDSKIERVEAAHIRKVLEKQNGDSCR